MSRSPMKRTIAQMRAAEAKETPADEAKESPAYQAKEMKYGIEKHGRRIAKGRPKMRGKRI